MTTITALIKRHPLPAYYTLTFAISWGGMLMVIGGPGGLPGTPEQADRLMGIAFSLMAGPSVSGLLLTGLVSGRTGLRDLLARLLRWRAIPIAVRGTWTRLHEQSSYRVHADSLRGCSRASISS